jgi:hypothetical protein
MRKCECNTILTSKHLSIYEAEEIEKLLSELVKKRILKKTHPLRVVAYFRMEIMEDEYQSRRWYRCRKCGCIWEYHIPCEKGGAWIRQFEDGKYPKWTIEDFREW